MSTIQSSEDESPLQDVTIVDTDVHVTFRGGTYGPKVAEQMDWPYEVLMDPTEKYGGYNFPSSGYHSTIPDKISVFDAEKELSQKESIEQELIDGLGVDYPLLNMTPMWDVYPDSEQILQEMPATNNVLLEEFLEPHDDYFGLISIAMRYPDKAAEEIDRLADEDKLVGVMIHPGGQTRSLGDRRYDPIWAAAEDNGLPVAFHTTASGFQWQMGNIMQGMHTMIELHGLSHPWSMMWALASFMANGTPAKFPDLDFVMLEAGISWVPFMMSRMNREYSTWRSQSPLLEQMPEDYIRDQFYFSTQPLGEFNRPAYMKDIIDIVGADSIMFSSDHPHFDFDNPETIRGYFNHMSEEEQELVFSQNAIDVFDLPI